MTSIAIPRKTFVLAPRGNKQTDVVNQPFSTKITN